MGFGGGPPIINIDTSVTPTNTDEANGALYGSGANQIKVERKNGATTANPVPENFVRYKHELKGISNFTLGSVKHNDQVLSGINTTRNVTAVYVYYEKTSDTRHQFPLIVCVKIDTSTRKYYTRGQTWEVDGNISVDPDEATAGSQGGTLNTTLDELKDRYEINIGKTSGTYKASAIGSITVEKKVGTAQTNAVPTGYVRYKHSPNNGDQFTLGLVKHDGFELSGITGGTAVEAVYVYYERTYDPNHEFPLIVCVDKGNPNYTYYKRGNVWKEESKITEGPEEDKVATQLLGKLTPLITQYEVKLEKTDSPGNYKARPDGHTINVTEVQPAHPTYKGYRHSVGQGNTINRITIHGHAIKGIAELENGTGITGKQFVFVYYENSDKNNERPLLICLQDSNGGAKTWYKRVKKQSENGYEWVNANAEIDRTADPNTISGFANKLDDIKNALTPGDIGYPKPLYILKLDYIAKNISTNNIKYRTKNEVITVEKQIGSSSNKKVPLGYAAYTHGPGTSISNAVLKYNGSNIPGLPNSGVNIGTNKVWVYYQLENDNPIIDKPLLIYVNDSTDTWYHRGIPWKQAKKVSGNPNSGNPQGHEAELGKMARLGLLWNLYILIIRFTVSDIILAIMDTLDVSGGNGQGSGDKWEQPITQI